MCVGLSGEIEWWKGLFWRFEWATGGAEWGVWDTEWALYAVSG